MSALQVVTAVLTDGHPCHADNDNNWQLVSFCKLALHLVGRTNACFTFICCIAVIYRARCVHSVQAFASFISQPPEAATAADSFSLKRIVCQKGSPFRCADMSATKDMQTLHPLQLCVFDTERDYPEGEEARQILAYHPEDCSIDDQTSVVGLAQALLTFTGNFDEASAHAVATCGSCNERRVYAACHAAGCRLRQHAGRAKHMGIS